MILYFLSLVSMFTFSLFPMDNIMKALAAATAQCDVNASAPTAHAPAPMVHAPAATLDAALSRLQIHDDLPAQSPMVSETRKTTELHECAKAGDVTRLRALVAAQQADLRTKDQHGASPLHYAAHALVAQELLDAGAPLEQTDDEGKTPFFNAVLKGKPILVAFFKRRGANINTPDIYGMTPLCKASMFGYRNIVAMLISWGCDLNKKCDDKSALHYFIKFNTAEECDANKEIVALFLALGAENCTDTKTGKTMVQLARGKGLLP